MDTEYKYVKLLFFFLLSIFFGFENSVLMKLAYFSYTYNNSYLWIGFAFTLFNFIFGLWNTLLTGTMLLLVECVLRRDELKQILNFVKSMYCQCRKQIENEEKEKEDNEDDEVDEFKEQDIFKNVILSIDFYIKYYEVVINIINNSVAMYYCMKIKKIVRSVYNSNKIKEILLDVNKNLENLFKFFYKLFLKIPFVNNLVENSKNRMGMFNEQKDNELSETYEHIDINETEKLLDNKLDNMLNDMISSTTKKSHNNMNDMISDMKDMKNRGELPEMLKPENMMKQLGELTDMIGKLANLQKDIESKKLK